MSTMPTSLRYSWRPCPPISGTAEDSAIQSHVQMDTFYQSQVQLESPPTISGTVGYPARHLSDTAVDPARQIQVQPTIMPTNLGYNSSQFLREATSTEYLSVLHRLGSLSAYRSSGHLFPSWHQDNAIQQICISTNKICSRYLWKKDWRRSLSRRREMMQTNPHFRCNSIS